MNSLIHIYCGDGKGKTTAAAGLAVRCAGAGKKVIFAQMIKPGDSSEIKVLENIPQVTVRCCDTVRGWVRDMGADEKAKLKSDLDAFLERLFEEAADADLLVLDESVNACRLGVLDEEKLLGLLGKRPSRLEVVLTGRGPSEALLEIADYVTEMKKIKHPLDRGIGARVGIEK